eukprot:3933312-Rhodomonas_salina.1
MVVDDEVVASGPAVDEGGSVAAATQTTRAAWTTSKAGRSVRRSRQGPAQIPHTAACSVEPKCVDRSNDLTLCVIEACAGREDGGPTGMDHREGDQRLQQREDGSWTTREV